MTWFDVYGQIYFPMPITDALMLLMRWCCCCPDADVLMLLMLLMRWCTDAADALMLLIRWCFLCADATDVLLLLLHWCWWCADALMLLMQRCCWCKDVSDATNISIIISALLSNFQITQLCSILPCPAPQISYILKVGLAGWKNPQIIRNFP